MTITGKGVQLEQGGGGGAFRSKTKMAHQMKGSAEKDAIVTSAARENLASASSANRGQAVANFGKHGEGGGASWEGEAMMNGLNNSDKYRLVQSFGTTAKRDTCPRVHDKAVPYASRSNSYSERQVGPGSYNTDLISSFNVKKGRTLRVEPVGFLGTAERPCLKTSDSRQSLSAPGPSPAQYNPSYYTMEFQAKKSALSSRKVGVFGTTGPRFRPKNNIEEEAERTEFNVGPGSYEHEAADYRPRPQKVPFVSAFRQQDRYAEGGAGGGGGGFVVTGNAGAAPPQAILPSDFDLRDDDTVENHKRSVRPAFGHSAARTSSDRNIDGSKFKDTPGPQYASRVNDMSGLRKKLVHGGRPRNREPSTFTKAVRSAPGVATGMPAGLGPGSYNLPGSISSHSFNITMKAKKQMVKRSTFEIMEREARRRAQGKPMDDASTAVDTISIAGDGV